MLPGCAVSHFDTQDMGASCASRRRTSDAGRCPLQSRAVNACSTLPVAVCGSRRASARSFGPWRTFSSPFFRTTRSSVGPRLRSWCRCSPGSANPAASRSTLARRRRLGGIRLILGAGGGSGIPLGKSHSARRRGARASPRPISVLPPESRRSPLKRDGRMRTSLHSLLSMRSDTGITPISPSRLSRRNLS